jgi:hypothetical protein
MAAYYRRVDTDYGEHEFTAEALQPARCALLFEFSIDQVTWDSLGWWAAYPEDQQVSVAVITRHPAGYIRAIPGPVQEDTRAVAHNMAGRWTTTARQDFPGDIQVGEPLTLTQLRDKLAASPPPPLPSQPV